MILEGYNSLISDSLNGVTQVKFEISSLTAYLDQWTKLNCGEQRPKPSVPGPLQELQSRKGFIHTVSFEALVRVKAFLNLLLKNLEHLETCWETDFRINTCNLVAWLMDLSSLHQWALPLKQKSILENTLNYINICIYFCKVSKRNVCILYFGPNAVTKHTSWGCLLCISTQENSPA